jgi:hypothetical protein
MTTFNEPEIIINGMRLSSAQAMAVRVAVTSYHGEMSDPVALGDDDHGRAMTKAYRERLSEVLRQMIP